MIEQKIKNFNGIRGVPSHLHVHNYTDEEIIETCRCMEDFIYFCSKYIKIVDQNKGMLIPFELYPYQRSMYKTYDKNNRVIVLAPRQSGKSVFTIAYLLWVALFQEYKTIVLIANKANTAKKTLQKLKQMFIHLPLFLKQGVTEWNMMQIAFDNGSKIYAEATSASGNRGDTVSILYIDECAIIEKNLMETFFASVYPTISAVKDSKIIISSTPNGYNFFYLLWTMAVNKQSEYVPFRVKWNEVPGRDDNYKTTTIAALGGGSKGLRKWRQEYECFFVGSGGSLIDGEALENMKPSIIHESRLDGRFLIYNEPEEGASYCVISDVAEGVGGDYSTSQVMKCNLRTAKYTQVAVFRDNNIKTNEFNMVIDQICKYYNNALAIVESNSIGREVLNHLAYDDEYENIFFDEKDFGLRMTMQSKAVGNSYLKTNIEDQNFIIQDHETISELSKYVKRGNVFKADEGQHDDLVTPLVLFSYFISKKENIENWIGSISAGKTKMQEKIESELLPVGFICNGVEMHDLNDVANDLKKDEDEDNEEGLLIINSPDDEDF